MEEPTQSLPNKNDVYTSSIYSKEIKARSCCSSSQHGGASKVNQHILFSLILDILSNMESFHLDNSRANIHDSSYFPFTVAFHE